MTVRPRGLRCQVPLRFRTRGGLFAAAKRLTEAGNFTGASQVGGTISEQSDSSATSHLESESARIRIDPGLAFTDHETGSKDRS